VSNKAIAPEGLKIIDHSKQEDTSFLMVHNIHNFIEDEDLLFDLLYLGITQIKDLVYFSRSNLIEHYKFSKDQVDKIQSILKSYNPNLMLGMDVNRIMRRNIVRELGFFPPPVAGYKFIVQLYIEPNTTAGGIFIPDTIMEFKKFNSISGKVIAMGPDCYEHPRFRSGPWIKLGDIVSINRNEGTQQSYRDIQIMIIDDDKLLLPRLEDPTYVKRN